MTSTTQDRPGSLARALPFTRADLEGMPDDGRRYEIIDGTLVVTSAPSRAHQTVLGNLHVLLRGGCPDHLQVLFAPFDVVLAEDTILQPDLLVAPRAQFTRKDLPGAPVLAVEVLSPSTARFDRLVKKERLQEAGLTSYWLVDPLAPFVVVFELQGGELREVGRATGDDRLDVRLPYPLTLVPADLLR